MSEQERLKWPDEVILRTITANLRNAFPPSSSDALVAKAAETLTAQIMRDLLEGGFYVVARRT